MKVQEPLKTRGFVWTNSYFSSPPRREWSLAWWGDWFGAFCYLVSAEINPGNPLMEISGGLEGSLPGIFWGDEKQKAWLNVPLPRVFADIYLNAKSYRTQACRPLSSVATAVLSPKQPPDAWMRIPCITQTVSCGAQPVYSSAPTPVPRSQLLGWGGEGL